MVKPLLSASIKAACSAVRPIAGLIAPHKAIIFYLNISANCNSIIGA